MGINVRGMGLAITVCNCYISDPSNIHLKEATYDEPIDAFLARSEAQPLRGQGRLRCPAKPT